MNAKQAMPCAYERPSELIRSAQYTNPRHRYKALSQLVLLLPVLRSGCSIRLQNKSVNRFSTYGAVINVKIKTFIIYLLKII